MSGSVLNLLSSQSLNSSTEKNIGQSNGKSSSPLLIGWKEVSGAQSGTKSGQQKTDFSLKLEKLRIEHSPLLSGKKLPIANLGSGRDTADILSSSVESGSNIELNAIINRQAKDLDGALEFLTLDKLTFEITPVDKDDGELIADFMGAEANWFSSETIEYPSDKLNSVNGDSADSLGNTNLTNSQDVVIVSASIAMTEELIDSKTEYNSDLIMSDGRPLGLGSTKQSADKGPEVDIAKDKPVKSSNIPTLDVATFKNNSSVQGDDKNPTIKSTKELENQLAMTAEEISKLKYSDANLRRDMIKEQQFSTAAIDNERGLIKHPKSLSGNLVQSNNLAAITNLQVTNLMSKSANKPSIVLPSLLQAEDTGVDLDISNISSRVNSELNNMTNASNISNTAASSNIQNGLVLNKGFNSNLALRIQWIYQQALSSAEILMDPPELGPLSVKISNNNGETNILFQATNPLTKDMIEDNLAKLRQLLGDQGINLGDTQVEQQNKEDAEGKQDSSKSAQTDSTQVESEVRVQEGLLDTYI